MKQVFAIAIGFAAVFGVALLSYTAAANAQSARLYDLATAPSRLPENERSSLASVAEAEISFRSQAESEVNVAKLTLPLFDGKTQVAERRSFEKRGPADFTWRGRVGEGDAVLTFKNGYVSGVIFSEKEVYEIIPRGGKHFLVKIDQSLFPECAGDISGEPAAQTIENAGGGSDSGDRIDVMVVYTTATKNFLGGDGPAQAFAQQAIDSANTVYLNSKVRQRVRLVHAQEFVYTETSSASTDLSNLRNNPTIIALRDTHKADLVAEISEVTGVCGIGYLMGGIGGNQNNAFTVTVRSCAVGNLSFVHELGHNMGSHHNPENGGTPTFPYGFGHYINGQYRTVMSYVDPCANGCVRRPYLSNPNVIHLGFPTGLVNARDNARSINNTADVITNYRYSGSSISLTSFNGGELFPRLIARNVTWTSDNVSGNVRIDISRDESSNWETLIASTPNDGSEPVSIIAPVTRRARLRVVSLSAPAVSDSSVNNISIR